MAHHLHLLQLQQQQQQQQTNALPLVLLQKLLSGQVAVAAPVDRRKAVTIGFNRWLRPLTFQVPDVISNLLPASSNLIKVHEDPKNNKSVVPAPESAKPVNPFDHLQQSPPQSGQHGMPMMPYDPLQLITNFDQNGFLKSGLPAGAGGPVGANFAFPNSSSFAFDESQLANMQMPLFSMPPSDNFNPEHSPLANLQMNEKPFPSMSQLYDQEESFGHSQEGGGGGGGVGGSRLKKPHFPRDFYSPSEDESSPPARHNHFASQQHSQQQQPQFQHQHQQQRQRPHGSGHRQQHRFPNAELSDEQPKQTYGDLMSEAFTQKEHFQSGQPSSYMGDYYPKEPHSRLPPIGSGNYDYGRMSAFAEPSRSNFYSSMPETAESDEKVNFANYGKKHPMNSAFANLQDDFGNNKEVLDSSSVGRPTFFAGTSHKGSSSGSNGELASTERTPYYQRDFPSVGSAFGNDTKRAPEGDHMSASDFYSTHLGKSSGSAPEGQLPGVPGHELKSTLFDSQSGKLGDTSDSAASFSSYFDTGYNSAASMLNPMVLKSDSTASSSGENESTGSSSGVGGNLKDKSFLTAANGVNVFPSSQMRPVASRIKGFFKSMLTQKY